MTLTTAPNGAQPHRPNLQESASTAEDEREVWLIRNRPKQLAYLVVDRHGRLPNTEGMVRYLQAAAWHCNGPDRRRAMEQWLEWVCAPAAVRRNVDVILRANPPRRIRADTIGKFLHVSDAERTRLRIYTIGSYDVPKAERIKRRKEQRRLADQARREEGGAKPRAQYLAEAQARREQQEAQGISRSTWYRKQKAAVRQPVRQVRGHYLTSRVGLGLVSPAPAVGPRPDLPLPPRAAPVEAKIVDRPARAPAEQRTTPERCLPWQSSNVVHRLVAVSIV